MQRYLAVSEVRQQFLKLVGETLEGDEIIITKHGKPAVVLIDFEQLENFKWLARLWSDPEAMQRMKEGMDDVKAGRAIKIKGPSTVENLLRTAREQGLVRPRITAPGPIITRLSYFCFSEWRLISSEA